MLMYLVALYYGAYSGTPFGSDTKYPTRWGPLLSTPFFATGWTLARNGWFLSQKQSLSIAGIGYFMHIYEALAIKYKYGFDIIDRDFFIGTMPWALGIFMFGLSLSRSIPPSLGNALITVKYTLGVYLIHPIFYHALEMVGCEYRSWLWELFRPILVFTISLSVIFLLQGNRRLAGLVQ